MSEYVTLPRVFQQGEYVVILTVPQALQEVQRGEDCAHFPATRCCIQVRIKLEAELARTAIVFDNPKNYALVLYVSIEPSKNNIF